MSLQDNKDLVRRFVVEVQNQHNLNALDELFSPMFYDHSGKTDLEGTRQFFKMMFTAFPDMHFTIHQQIAEGDQVVTFKTFHGTHSGPFMGLPGTGQSVAIDVMDILTVTDGQITEHWTVSDMLGMMQQIGMVPTP
ncbi:MAG: ester cyclase [Anaerolineae bacterium]|nr:ester cyclase [Anaerolineae bacterium]MCO5187980.1 ester cyclase [Anaerolineae bacterium]MCO5198628.1 ester cyclase [Anaerolineae bacterium]